MKAPQYEQTPLGIMLILSLFIQHKLSYVLFKCDHIFEGQNKNLDILFQTNENYHTAAALLEQQGFVVRLSEKVEKYKTMYCGLINNTMYSIHLHREIAWHGMIALDKQPVFQRAQQVHPLITIPSIEDSILIHAAHVLFENFIAKDRERNYFLKFNEQSIDKDYIGRQIRKNHWEKGFWKVIQSENISKIEIAKAWIGKIWKEPATATYLSLKALRIPLRKLSFKRRGCLIALIGVNGSGKSTLSKTLVEQYKPITDHLGKKVHYYYFGWKPTFPLTKYLSGRFQKINKKMFQEINLDGKMKIFDLRQELLFLYLTFEFYYRYRKEILLLLKKGELIICDRYFYDVYGQYPYARNSYIIKYVLKVFPKPDFMYILDAEEQHIQKRQKSNKDEILIQSIERRVFPIEYLQQQRINFNCLAKYLNGTIINTNKNIGLCIQQLIEETWKKTL